jgi:hypothetical protein
MNKENFNTNEMKNITFKEKINKTIQSYEEDKSTELKIIQIQLIDTHGSMVLHIPNEFVNDLNLVKDDYVKCYLKNRQLVVEKEYDLISGEDKKR